ncbi:MAG: hypothetical protein A2408_03650 [Candidatus Yonathbacteria bacterium RIFOXYC1_FULL_52_10]|nr:MAG: hypothetical protein A2408_03650 [Candidatus Yonathbacteria bacterium RIFOXYC1_FULL_52_10]
MEFHVPQFIDIEDKIFGPFTWKQFLFMVGGGGTGYLLYTIVGIFPFDVLLGLGALGGGLALAFYPKDRFGKPFSQIVESAIRYTLSEKLYTWKRAPRQAPEAKSLTERSSHAPLLNVSNVSKSKLSDRAWNMTVGKE